MRERLLLCVRARVCMLVNERVATAAAGWLAGWLLLRVCVCHVVCVVYRVAAAVSVCLVGGSCMCARARAQGLSHR